jgi:hypothetical protein
MKTCSICNESKPNREFTKSATGKQKLRAECRPCHNELQKVQAKERLEARMVDGKVACSKCGEVKPATTEYFYKYGYGLAGMCKVCRAKYDRAYHKAKVKEDPIENFRVTSFVKMFNVEQKLSGKGNPWLSFAKALVATDDISFAAADQRLVQEYINREQDTIQIG